MNKVSNAPVGTPTFVPPLRVWHAFNDGSHKMHHHNVNTPEEAIKLIDKLGKEQLHDDSIDFNAFGLEEYVDGVWSEWYNEDGDDIESAILYPVTE